MWTVDKESPCKVVVTAAHLLLAARPRALFIVDRHARVCLARAARPSIRRSFIQHLLSGSVSFVFDREQGPRPRREQSKGHNDRLLYPSWLDTYSTYMCEQTELRPRNVAQNREMSWQESWSRE